MTPTTIWVNVVGDLHYWYLAFKLSAQMIWDQVFGPVTNGPHLCTHYDGFRYDDCGPCQAASEWRGYTPAEPVKRV